MPTLTIAERWKIADRYYAEGCELVAQCDELWSLVFDPARTAGLTPDRAHDVRVHAQHDYPVLAARARTCFRRHDLQLDLIERDQAVLDANATTR